MFEQIQRILDDGQGFQAQKVELHQTCSLDPLHVELRGGHFRTRVAVEGDKFVKRAIADHDARGVGRGIPEQAFDLLAVGEKAVDDFFRLRLFPKAGLVGQRLFDRDGFDAFDGDQLGQAVDLSVRHLKHAAHVADGGFGQKRAKRDDLPHPVAAVFFLHVTDHLFAAVHTEVDVEVRHRDPFGVEETFEQEPIAERVEVRDGEGVGHERPRAGPPARTHGNVVVLGPFDEVGDDQEVARKPHALDHAQFEIEPRLIVFYRGGRVDHSQTRLEPFLGLAAQFFDLVLGKTRQYGVVFGRREGAAACNFNGVLKRFWQISEERRHFGRRLEVVLLGQTAPRLGLIDIGALGDANQGIMRLVHFGLVEIDVICRNQRKGKVVGQIDAWSFGHRFGFGQCAAFLRVTLKLDVKAVRKRGRQTLCDAAGILGFGGAKRAANRAIRATGKTDQPIRMRFNFFERHLWERVGFLEVER